MNFQGLLNYCDTANLNSDEWYHYAFAIKESPSNFGCYLNGNSLSVGTNPSVLISQSIVLPTELTLGGTSNPIGGEVNFIGRMKEFRWWNKRRSAFDINGFKNVAFTAAPSILIAYWRLDEKNDGTDLVFVDSSGDGTFTFDPSPILVS